MLDAGFVIAYEGLRLTKKMPGNTGYGHAQPPRLGLPFKEAWHANDPDGIGTTYLAGVIRARTRFWRSVALSSTNLYTRFFSRADAFRMKSESGVEARSLGLALNMDGIL
jgi:hypothetical protein